MNNTRMTQAVVAMVACWQLPGNPTDAQFTDQTQSAGIVFQQTFGGIEKDFIVEAHGSGAGFLDYDGDGDIDLYMVNGSTIETYLERSGPGNALYANQGDGTFAEIAEQVGVADAGWGSGVTAGDVDGDGAVDLYVTNFGANILYRNRTPDGFVDATGDGGVAGDDYSTSAAFFDYDGDGDLDLYVANYLEMDFEATRPQGCNYIGDVNVYCGPKGMPGADDVLYRNQGQGRFVDVTDETGIGAANHHYGLGVAPEDFDGDGDTDLYVANDATPNVLFSNQGDGTFKDVALLSGVAYNSEGDEEAGMGIDFGDYDGDGDQDLYVTNFFRESNTLYRNDGVRFTDWTVRAGLEAPTMTRLGWGTHFFDYDSDADLDLFVANGHVFPQVDRAPAGTSYGQRNQLLRNDGAGRFKDISALAGPGMEVEKVSRGACFGDYDDDGDVDVLVVNLNDSPTLLRNDYSRARHRLAVQLVGTRIIDGTGATVRATVGGHVQTRTVRGASSYMSYNDTRVFFGLDDEDVVDKLEVVWPGGSEIQHILDVEADQLIVIKQGQAAVEAQPLR